MILLLSCVGSSDLADNVCPLRRVGLITEVTRNRRRGLKPLGGPADGGVCSISRGHMTDLVAGRGAIPLIGLFSFWAQC